MNRNILHCSLSFIADINKRYFFTALFVALSILSVAQTRIAPDLEWQKSLGGSKVDQARSIQETEDGGYIIAGSSSSNDANVTGNHGGIDCWIVKLSDKGIIEWQKSLGGTGTEIASSIDKTEDGGYIVAGYSTSNDGDVTGNHGGSNPQDYWVVKLDGNGTIKWQKSLGGTNEDFAYSIEQTFDFGYIVAGSSKSNDGDVSGHHGNSFNTDYWIVKLDSLGVIEWEQSLGGIANDAALAIKQAPDGGYVAAGYSFSSDGDITDNKGSSDYWIIKLDGTGAKQWQKNYGGSSSDGAQSIENTSDDGFIIAGSSDSQDGPVGGTYGSQDCLVLKIDGSGNIQWGAMLGGSDNDGAWCDIKPTFNGGDGYILAISSRSNDFDVNGNHGGDDFWIVRLGGVGDILWQKSLGGGSNDIPYSIDLNSLDDGYIIAGLSSSKNGDVSGNHDFDDFWIAKLGAETFVYPTTYITNANGSWNDPGIWLDNLVTPAGASVIIRHSVWVNVNVVCNDLKLIPPAYVTVNPGITITVLH